MRCIRTKFRISEIRGDTILAVKKIVLIVIIVVGVFGIMRLLEKREVASPISQVPVSPTQALGLKNNVKKNAIIRSVFVPYWAVGSAKSEDFSSYSEVLYFGISPTNQGINQEESGYKELNNFAEKLKAVPKKWLVIRLNNSDIATDIIEHDDASQRVILDSIAEAKRWGFTGILVDLELQAFPFDSVTNNITKFNTSFAEKVHAQQLQYGITLYGDTFYRARPYNVNDLVDIADKSFIMTYDLHKANGEPGPNFPLRGKENYGYDLETLANKLKDYSPEKIVYIFGNFGYNWKIDEDEKPSGTAISQTNAVIKNQFIDTCIFSDCTLFRDPSSTEMKITYRDKQGESHVIWMNDEESTRQKEQFLQEKGIYQFSTWAYSY